MVNVKFTTQMNPMLQPIHTVVPIESLFELCTQVSPYLQGELGQNEAATQDETNWVCGRESDVETVHALYKSIEKEHSNAGQAYWMTRTWDLLCWQPIYVSFISIYGLNAIPDFSSFRQKSANGYTAGFQFSNRLLSQGDPETLVSLVALQLKSLFEHYRQTLDQVCRCRPGYVKRLIADAIVASLIRVQQLQPTFSNLDIRKHTQVWLRAMDCPTPSSQSLKTEPNQQVEFVRTSCCLADKIGHDYCADCPKLKRIQ